MNQKSNQPTGRETITHSGNSLWPFLGWFSVTLLQTLLVTFQPSGTKKLGLNHPEIWLIVELRKATTTPPNSCVHPPSASRDPRDHSRANLVHLPSQPLREMLLYMKMGNQNFAFPKKGIHLQMVEVSLTSIFYNLFTVSQKTNQKASFHVSRSWYHEDLCSMRLDACHESRKEKMSISMAQHD